MVLVGLAYKLGVLWKLGHMETSMSYLSSLLPIGREISIVTQYPTKIIPLHFLEPHFATLKNNSNDLD